MVETYSIAPAETKTLVFIAGLALLLGAMLALFLYLAYSSQNSRFALEQDGLRIQGDFYGRTISYADLRTSEARRIDLNRNEQLRPSRRRMGTGMPGYRSGWFQLANKEKALVYVTDMSRAVYVPTTLGYSLLLSVEQPDRFLSALRHAGSAS